MKRTTPSAHASRNLVLGCLAALAAAVLVAPGAAGAGACPNEALRAGSSQLADCRAYEMVSPADMNGNGIEQAFAVSPDGNAIAYGTINTFGNEAPSSITGKWIGRRGGGEWTSRTINAPILGRVPTAYDEPVALDFSADFSAALIGSRYPFDPRDQAPYGNFVESGNADIYRVLTGGRQEWTSYGSELPDTNYVDRGLAGASADLSKVFFQTREELLPQAAGSTAQNLYEREGDELRVVNVDEDRNLIPGGAATGRGLATAGSFYSGSEYQQGSTAQGHPFDPSAVSADGSTVFFTAPLEPETAPRQVYVSVERSGSRLVSACDFGTCAGGGAPDGAIFLFAAPDGSTVTFYSSDRLIESADVGGGIYRYDVEEEALRFLAPLAAAGSVSHDGGVLAASEDGSYLYLCEGGTELAVYHVGSVRSTSIASIPCDAGGRPEAGDEPTTAREGFTVEGVKGITQGEPTVTANAGYLFSTNAGPAAIGNGYPNEGHTEVYYYDAAAASLHCLSCRPDGAPARADSALDKSLLRADGSFVVVPGPVEAGISPRNLSASGERAFFVSEEALLPSDVDGSQDVYEWEAPGSGSCTAGGAGYVPAAGGCLSLVTPGQGPGAGGAVFEGASADGSDVFFASHASLVPADTGTEMQLYDARVEGGLPAQHQVATTPCGDAPRCRGEEPAVPGPTPTATAHYSGPGNAAEGAAGCASQRQRARALKTKAKAARETARRARSRHQSGKAKRMEGKRRRLATKAGRAARQVKRCTGGNRGAAK